MFFLSQMRLYSVIFSLIEKKDRKNHWKIELTFGSSGHFKIHLLLPYVDSEQVYIPVNSGGIFLHITRTHFFPSHWPDSLQVRWRERLQNKDNGLTFSSAQINVIISIFIKRLIFFPSSFQFKSVFINLSIYLSISLNLFPSILFCSYLSIYLL